MYKSAKFTFITFSISIKRSTVRDTNSEAHPQKTESAEAKLLFQMNVSRMSVMNFKFGEKWA
jgi:hypothetical protein